MTSPLRPLWSFAKQHPAVGFTALYAYACLWAGIHERALLGQFDLEYFDYAAAPDLVVSAFRRPAVALILLVFTPAALILVHTVQTRSDTSREADVWHLILLAIVLFGLAFPWSSAKSAAENIKEGWGTYARLGLPGEQGPQASFADRDVQLVGSTSSHMFVFDRSADRAYAVSRSAMRWVRTCRSRKPPGSDTAQLVRPGCRP